MRVSDGFYWLPILSQEFSGSVKDVDKADWPADVREEYKKLRVEFTASKAEYASWIRKDRDSRMNGTAKAILGYILDCLNFDTGRCDPSHQTIADELGISVRTVERTIPRIAESGWIAVTRRGKTTSNFYRLRVSVEKITWLLNTVDDLRIRRTEEREERRRLNPMRDPTEMADHFVSDPTSVRSHDPTEMADHEPTELTGKHMNRTLEGEHLNKNHCSEGEGFTQARSLETDIPVDEVRFGVWVRANIPDPTRHREALRLLRERKMTPEILQRMAA